MRLLEVVGTFRVVPEDDLARDTPKGAFNSDVRHLTEQRLLTCLTINIHRQPTRVLALTPEGKSLVEARRSGSGREARQVYHAGFVKPREVAHDAQLYRVYKAEEQRIEAEGGRVTRVVLDYEIKRDYQTFLNRHRSRDEEQDAVEARVHDRDAFAAAHDLPVIDDHLEIPDLRIEYETPHGRTCYRDLELVTEHYSRSQMAGKRSAGFALYRGSSGGRTGGTPSDPRHVERLA